MRKIIIAAVAVVAVSILSAVGLAVSRPDLVPSWARLRPPPPESEAVADSEPLEPGPDDGWLGHLGSKAPADAPAALPTVRLANPETAERVGIETAEAEAAEIAPHVSGNAEISFVTHDYAHITSRVEGRIARVPADEGDVVKKGDLLVVVDSAEVGSAKALYLSLLPMTDLARRESARIASLRPSGAASAKEELAASATLAQAEAGLLEARQKLRNMGYDDEEITKIAADRDTSNFLEIRSPMSGRLVERHAVVGEAVTPPRVAVTSGQMTALFDVADISEMWCWIDVAESDVTKAEIGQEVRFTISETAKPVFRGEVQLVSFAVNAATRTVRVRAGLKNVGERLRANQYGRASIQVGPKRTAIVVPRSAVQSSGADQFVFLPMPDGVRFRTQRVEVRPTDRGDRVEIAFGLSVGDRVVTTGSFLLKSELQRENLVGE